MEQVQKGFLGFSEAETPVTTKPNSAAHESPRLVVKEFTFSEAWCELFFRISGDKNFKFHHSSGYGIVQGTAILTQMGTMVSEVMPGYVPVDFLGTFPNWVHIGETITITMERLDHGRAKTRVRFTTRVLDCIVSTCEATLVSNRVTGLK